MRLKLLAAALLPAFLGSAAVEARVTRIVVDPARSQSPTFDGRAFGAAGQYEKLRGTFHGELDPRDRRNRVITDIELAPRNARGMVEYSAEFFILKPIDASKGNHKVILDHNNRGGMRIGLLNGVPANNNPTSAADAGTGFVFNQGYAVVSNGWDPGAVEADEMKISVPVAKNRDGSSITGPSYEYIVFDNATTRSSPLTYPAANPADKATAKLTVRKLLDDMPTPVPADGWSYNADGTAISLAGNAPFLQSYIYEFTYTAKDPIVAAIGLAATRDFTSFLKNASKDDAGTANPLRGNVQRVYTYSISQPSRMLNDVVHLGFNEDEKGKQVFDGILSHTGAGTGDAINFRFAQTGRTERNRQNHLYPEGLFPFAHQLLYDPVSGQVDARDLRCTLTNTCPKRFEMNTSNEYWVKSGSLLHTDTRGRDLRDPDEARFYLFSGLSHGVGAAGARSSCQQLLNPTSPYPAHRALLVALDEWVTRGKEPPKSRVPRASDGNVAWAATRPGFQTGVVSASDLGWPSIPNVTYTGVITTRYVLDFGPNLRDGIISNYPPSVSARPWYPIFVSKVDADGNEVAGVRLPPVAAPLATTTGWGVRREGFAANDGCEANGQQIFFEKTLAARLAKNDPRLSLAERYGSKENYVKAVTAAAKKLQAERFLLQADVDAYVSEANATTAFNP
jgi:hypothetical protein